MVAQQGEDVLTTIRLLQMQIHFALLAAVAPPFPPLLEPPCPDISLRRAWLS